MPLEARCVCFVRDSDCTPWLRCFVSVLPEAVELCLRLMRVGEVALLSSPRRRLKPGLYRHSPRGVRDGARTLGVGESRGLGASYEVFHKASLASSRSALRRLEKDGVTRNSHVCASPFACGSDCSCGWNFGDAASAADALSEASAEDEGGRRVWLVLELLAASPLVALDEEGSAFLARLEVKASKRLLPQRRRKPRLGDLLLLQIAPLCRRPLCRWRQIDALVSRLETPLDSHSVFAFVAEKLRDEGGQSGAAPPLCSVQTPLSADTLGFAGMDRVLRSLPPGESGLGFLKGPPLKPCEGERARLPPELMSVIEWRCSFCSASQSPLPSTAFRCLVKDSPAKAVSLFLRIVECRRSQVVAIPCTSQLPLAVLSALCSSESAAPLVVEFFPVSSVCFVCLQLLCASKPLWEKCNFLRCRR